MMESGRSAVAPVPAPSARSRLAVTGIALAALSPAVLLLSELTPWPWLPALLGRAHPLILHFPIAFLLLAAGMEAIEVISRGRFRFAPGFVLFAGSFGAVLAASCGFLLMRADAVEGTQVDRHFWGGITVAVLSVLAVLIQRAAASPGRRGLRFGYRALMLALCVAVVITGHYGSTLTHGEEYLTEHLPWNTGASRMLEPKFPTDRSVEQWAAYKEVVGPILETRCVACHNSTNFKGKLVLDHWEGISRGGKTGPLWVDGNPSDSLLIERLLLPVSDEKHMPPKKKLQPSPAEIALLQLWVKAGAPAEGIPQTLAKNEAWLTAARKLPGLLIAAYHHDSASSEETHEMDPAKVAQARLPVEKALSPLRSRFPGLISYESRESADLRINASLLGTGFGDTELAALEPLREWIVDLDLSETAITDASAPVLARMIRLRVLRLNSTQISDATVTALAQLTALESIGLFRTGVSDAGAKVMSKLPKLRRIYAGETKITSADFLSPQSLGGAAIAPPVSGAP